MIAYLPALLSSPGRMPADTKLYLYLDPGELIAKAPKAWDVSQFGGWVPHQMIQYLWPAGPWFWLCERIGLPDWVAHRVWIATLMFLAGLGVFRFLRAWRLPLSGAAIAALVYQLSPYLLPYISRTSVMLLPWAALGWLLLLTMRAMHDGGWRAPAMIALVACTAAGVNATAFAAILPAPVIWVLLEWRAGSFPTRRVLAATARIGLLAGATAVWWVTALSLQRRYGADVLGYSETLDAVTYTSNSVEVMRGLGYWLFYVKDPYAAATTSSIPYQQSLFLIAVGFLLLLLCLLGLALARFRQRRFAVLMVVVGVIAAVGVHPYADPSPAAEALRGSGLALALRSSTRALPLMVLGLGLGAAALVTALQRQSPRGGRSLGAVVVVLAAANLPSLWTADLVDPALARDQDPPSAWIDAARALDATDLTSRVLQLPGAEFGAFRWGYTVDPPLPGLTDKPLLTRDLLPLGSPQLMDLLFALDDRVQSGQLDPAALAPVARLLAADRVWISGDMTFERFRTIRPELFAAMIAAAPGLSAAEEFGAPVANEPDIPMIDEDSIGDQLVGTPTAPVQLLAVGDPTGIARVAARVVVLDGSGDGIVDAAAAGLLFGDEAVFYAGDLAELGDLPGDTLFIVTDSNRDRDREWRGSQDTTGFTESGGSSRDGQAASTAAVRLPLFESDDADGQTVATLAGGITAQASSYGDPFALFPEYRPAMAVDGDATTGWRVGMRWAPVGEHITLAGTQATKLQLLQLQGPQLRRMITGLDIDVDGELTRVVLDETSLVAPGQTVAIPAGDELKITITDVADRPGAPEHGEDWVGLAEMGPVAQEWVRPPTTVLTQAPEGAPIALVLRRESARPTDRWRADPEPTLARVFDLESTLVGEMELTLRIAERADDAALDALAGTTGAPTADRRLTGVPGARASAAFDGDPTTRWVSPFNAAVGSTLTVALLPRVSVDSFRMLQPADGPFAPITAVRVTAGSRSTLVPVPAPDAAGYSTISFPPVTGGPLAIEVAAVETRTTTERRLGVDAALPAAIGEIDGLPIATETAPPSACRDDLVALDGRPLAIQVDADALLAGRPVEATLCAGSTIRLAAGRHELLSSPGRLTGIDVEAVTIVPEGATGGSQRATPEVSVEAFADTEARLEVGPCADDCWLIFGQGHNRGWEASVDGVALGDPVPISGGANGWLLPSAAQSREVVVRFTPQRTLDIALVFSLVAVAACILLAIGPFAARVARRRGRRHDRTPAPSRDDRPMLVAPWQPCSRRRAAASAVLLVVSSTAFIGPWWALAALPVAVTLALQARPRLAALTVALGFAACGVLVMGVVVVRGTAAGPGWAGQLEPLHRPGMFLVLLLASTIVVDDRNEYDTPTL